MLTACAHLPARLKAQANKVLATGGGKSRLEERETVRAKERHPAAISDSRGGVGVGVADHLIYIISLLPAVNVLIRLILLRPPDVLCAWVSRCDPASQRVNKPPPPLACFPAA